MSQEHLEGAKAAWLEMTNAERGEFRAWVGANGGDIPTPKYDPESFVAGEHRTLDAFDEYDYPARDAANDLTFIMGVICGIPLAGFDALPREQTKVMAAVLSAYISNMEAENARLQHGMKEMLDLHLPDNWYSIDQAQELKRACIDFYSGRGSKRFAEFLADMPVVRWLLGIRADFRPGNRVLPHMSLLDRMLANEVSGDIHERGRRYMRQLEQAEQRGEIDDPRLALVLKELKGMAKTSQMDNTLRKRQSRHNRRITDLD